jgi:hypothetical protein
MRKEYIEDRMWDDHFQGGVNFCILFLRIIVIKNHEHMFLTCFGIA